MSTAGWLQLIALGVLIAISTPLLGRYMARVYAGGDAPGDRIFGPIDRLIYKICRIDPDGEQRWTTYTFALLAFSAAGIVLLYGFQRLQGHLPLNPDHMPGVTPGLSFNTSVSFTTNTDWQTYAGESTMSQLTQMTGLVVQMFLSAAVGMAVAAALIRAFSRTRRTTLGSFWVDTVRSCTRILLPLSFVFALVFMSQGVIQNFHSEKPVTTIAAAAGHTKGATATQKVPGGPVASLTPIETLGDNGGGYFNANMGHPYQNPNPLTNLLYYWLVLMIPFAFPYTFGKMIGSMSQGWVLFASMAILFVVPLVFTSYMEGNGNPKLTPAGVSQRETATQPGGNMEGKEERLGTGGSAMGSNSITATSAGAMNSSIESYLPLGGGAVLSNMLLGEVSPGGAGGGLYGKLILAMVSVFIAGLMVGRTPEYLGKKIQASEMKLVVVYILAVPLVILAFSAAAIVIKTSTSQLSASGPHGLTEMVYNYTSAANNNGSAFGGISANTNWFNSTLGITMLVGRYLLIVPVMAIAGSLVRKQRIPATSGTFPTNTPLFVGLLLGVTVILVGLEYFPVMSLGPIVEHLAGHF